LAQPDVLQELPDLPSNWTLQPWAGDHGRLQAVRQLVWEQQVLPRIADRWRADVLLSFGSFVPLRSPCATVLEAGNALHFTQAFWHVLRREPLRRRLEEHARWSLLKRSLRSATRVLVPTRAMRQDVAFRLPDIIHRIDVAVWGVAPVFHATEWADPGQDVLFGVSKHGINKEFDVLLSALPSLAADVRLVLTGTPNESRWSRQSAALVDGLGLAHRVTWAGDVPNRELPAYVRRARVLVFPTWCESFGLPLAEALAMGAPAIAADIPACREVGGDAALYYEPGDATSLGAAVDRLLRDPELRQKVSNAARERGQHFSWRTNAVEVRASLERAL
jgi:alpha-1,3-rhamnosyl/mannosyltransferase